MGCLDPVAHEHQALALIAGGAPTCAVVNINLGDGPSFVVSEALQDAGIPFVFVTGYDDVVVPARFDAIERLRKPLRTGRSCVPPPGWARVERGIGRDSGGVTYTAAVSTLR